MVFKITWTTGSLFCAGLPESPSEIQETELKLFSHSEMMRSALCDGQLFSMQFVTRVSLFVFLGSELVCYLVEENVRKRIKYIMCRHETRQ